MRDTPSRPRTASGCAAAYNVTLPWNIEAKVDLDYVSDRNFLQEFTRGSTSSFNSDALFRQYFGRGILYDQTSLVRESTIYLEKRGESDLLSMDIRYWENLERGRFATTVQKLPAFSYSIIPKRIDDTPLYYTLDSSAVNYWRQQGDTEQRLDVYPRVYYPLHWGNYLDVEPSAGFRADSYAIQWQRQFRQLHRTHRSGRQGGDEHARQQGISRLISWTLRLSSMPFAPEVSYEYATQSMFGNQTTPLIDRLDQYQARDGVRYGFSTFLTGKEVAKDANGNPILDADGNPTTIYRELVRFRVFQFFNVEPPAVEDPMFDTQNIMPLGFSPVGFRLDITPKQYFSISYDVDVDLNSKGREAPRTFS